MRLFLALAPLALFLACSGSTTTLGNGPDGGSSSEGGSGDASGSSSGSGSSGGGGDAAKGTDASDASSGTDGSSGGGDGSGGPDSSGGDGAGFDAGPCPDISGSYGQIATTGLGCGDLNPKAPECIVLAQQICAFQLTSSSGVIPAVNGVVMLASDGSFTNASLQFGTLQRTGCVGQWDAGSQTLTLDCGGKGTTQSCIVTMVRSSAPCP